MNVMKQSINITDKGLRFVQIGLFSSRISHILEEGSMTMWRTNLYNDDWERNTDSDIDIVAGKVCTATISFLSEDANFGQH